MVGSPVQLVESGPFGGLPTDETLEETVNKNMQTIGGTEGCHFKTKCSFQVLLNGRAYSNSFRTTSITYCTSETTPGSLTPSGIPFKRD
jgi:hypothetical protein